MEKNLENVPKFKVFDRVIDAAGFPDEQSSFSVRTSVWDEDREDFKVYDFDDNSWAWEKHLVLFDTKVATESEKLSYTVVEAPKLEVFLLLVNLKIKQGYIPQGGVSVHENWYSQAMILKE